MLNIPNTILTLALFMPTVLSKGVVLRNVQHTLSHLSPLLTYTPADAWTHTLSYSYTTEPGTRVTFRHWGVQLSINNVVNATDPPTDGIDIIADPPFEQWGERKKHLPQGTASRDLQNGTSENYTFWPSVVAYDSTLQWRNLSIELPTNTTMTLPEEERTLNISRFGWVYPMPIDRDWVDNLGQYPSRQTVSRRATLLFEPAIQSDNSTIADRYTVQGGWHAAEQNETLQGLSSTRDVWGPGIASGYEPGPRGPEFMNRSLISINASSAGVNGGGEEGADLSFDVVERTSRLQLFGAVGPDMGRMTVHLSPQPLDREVSDNVDIPIANLSAPRNREDDNAYVYAIDTNRPLELLGQLLLTVPLDARVRYNVTIRPSFDNGTSQTDDGPTRIALHGASFASYAVEEDEWYEDDWVADRNQELAYRLGWEARPSEPLDGGKIAGIVVGSVAGALLIATLIFFCYRHERKRQDAEKARLEQSKSAGSSASRAEQGAMEDDQRTMRDSSSAVGVGGSAVGATGTGGEKA